MPKFEVTEEIIIERTVVVEADDETTAVRAVDLGQYSVIEEFQSTHPTLIRVLELEDDGPTGEPDVQSVRESEEQGFTGSSEVDSIIEELVRPDGE
jgi:hypothetical protein